MNDRRPRFVHVLPPAYVCAIGGVVVQWSFFEVDLDNAVHFFRNHPDAVALSDKLHANVKQRLKLFRDSAELAFANFPSVRSRLLAIGSAASQLGALRHDIAHARWRGEDDELAGYSVRFGNWGTARKIVSSLQQIEETATRISELHFNLHNVLHAGLPKNFDELLSDTEITEMVEFRLKYLPMPAAPMPPYLT